jgi:hypothetical protein
MSKIEVDAIEPQSGTTLTIGASGDSVNIASGATITDFTSTGIDDNATSTAITIDSSERVGIGTASPAELLNIVGSSGDAKIRFDGDISNLQNNFIGCLSYDDLTIASDESNTGAASTIQFRVDAAECMRIDSSGNVLFNTTGIPNGTSIYGSAFEATTRNRAELNMALSTTESAIYMIRFFNPNGEIGHISTSGTSGISYNTSSDYRLKENVNYDFDATTRLKQLKPARFNFIADADTTVDGFLAHEVSSVVPEAISGTKDETETKEKVVVNANGKVIAENIEQADWETGKIADKNGNTKYPTDSTWEATKVVPVYQGIDQAKLVPLLVKTIQELEARITQLENA